jgi:hypothetical protein
MTPLSVMLSTVLLATTPALAVAQAPAAPAPAQPTSDAPVSQPQAAATQDDTIDAQIAAWTNSPQGGQPPAQADGTTPPRQIHGEAGLSFGNHGYREGYVYADIPIGQNSDLGVGVDDGQFKARNGRTVENKSLFLSLSIGTGDKRGPGGCRAAPMAMDGRYLEPMWIAQAHGEALARDQADCEAARANDANAPGPNPNVRNVDAQGAGAPNQDVWNAEAQREAAPAPKPPVAE